VLAVAWSAGLLVAAVVAPAYGSATLVDENGSGVLLVVAVPAVVRGAACVVPAVLLLACATGLMPSGSA
jgi:hypothetical protein